LADATPMPSRSPHDALFKASMQDPARAADLLRLVLPPEIFAQLDVASLRIEPNTYLDAKSAELRSDLLLSVDYGNTPAFVYVLLEHKSYPDRWVRLQMLGYMVAIWRSTAGVGGAPLRPIVPVLISHAEGDSRGSTCLADLFGSVLSKHPELQAFVPEFDLVHEDLRERDDASLRQAALHPAVVMTLLALRDARRGEVLATLRRFMLELRALAQLRDATAVYRQLVDYLWDVAPDLSDRDFHAILAEAADNPEETMPTLADRYRADGQREILRKQLTQKFGHVDASHEQRLESADREELERIGERVLAANTIDAVFATDS
jgi:predicted transposase/invertase (TIGR01784 family)